MRDTLALALLRAELCRAHWAEHDRLSPHLIGKVIRLIRRMSRLLVPDGGHRAASSPPD